MLRAVYSGLPVVRVGRGNTEGFVPLDNPALIGGSNLTATKARLLLMACLMKLGALPPGGQSGSAYGRGNRRCLREGRRVSNDLQHALKLHKRHRFGLRVYGTSGAFQEFQHWSRPHNGDPASVNRESPPTITELFRSVPWPRKTTLAPEHETKRRVGDNRAKQLPWDRKVSTIRHAVRLTIDLPPSIEHD